MAVGKGNWKKWHNQDKSFHFLKFPFFNCNDDDDDDDDQDADNGGAAGHPTDAVDEDATSRGATFPDEPVAQSQI